MRSSNRGRIRAGGWRSEARGVATTLAAVGLLAGCGGQSAPKPLPLQQLLSAFTTSNGGTYESVITATGHGTRSFQLAGRSGGLGIEMSCRGGNSVQAQVGRINWIKVYCAPGQAGGGTESFRHASRFTIHAPPHTRWSVVVEARTR